MDFKAFTDALIAANVTTADIADALGVSQNTVLRARMDPSSPNARPAPKEWLARLQPLISERITRLEQLRPDALDG